jgi:TadE-like protein
MARTRGQASVETVLLLPVLAVLAVAAWQGLVAAWTLVEVQDAAHAGARAAMVGEPVRDVVAHALPSRLRSSMRVQRRGDQLTVGVTLPTLIPGFSPRLQASAPVARQ